MKTAAIKIEIEGSDITSSVRHAGDITLNEFCNVLDGLKKAYASAAIRHCQKNNIDDVAEFALNTTLSEFSEQVVK
jgi:hypothetical protein